jgi:hypothetical protein
MATRGALQILVVSLVATALSLGGPTAGAEIPCEPGQWALASSSDRPDSDDRR